MAERRNVKREVLECLGDGQWWSAKQIALATGASASSIITHLNELLRIPHAESVAERSSYRQGQAQYRAKHKYLYPLATFVERIMARDYAA